MTAPQAIALALQARGLTTQRAQASMIGTTYKGWNRYLSRKGPSPTGRTLAMWADAAGLRLSYTPKTGWVAHESG